MNNILISIIVCTRNRSEHVLQALDSLIAQTYDRSKWEILIVDNGSTDDTQRCLKEYIEKHPKYTINMFYVETPGLSISRNHAIPHAKGQYLSFFDDDALAPPDWIQSMMDMCMHVSPKPIIVGGKIVPRYQSRKPFWFDDAFETDEKGNHPRFLSYGEVFSSSNMVIHKDVFADIGMFDESLGMKGELMRVGEETYWMMRVWKRYGDRCWVYYHPNIVVLHTISKEKMRVSYRVFRSYVSGKARVYMMKDERTWRMLNMLFMSMSVIVFFPAVFVMMFIRHKVSFRAWIYAIEILAYGWGYIHGFVRSIT